MFALPPKLGSKSRSGKSAELFWDENNPGVLSREYENWKRAVADAEMAVAEVENDLANWIAMTEAILATAEGLVGQGEVDPTDVNLTTLRDLVARMHSEYPEF